MLLVVHKLAVLLVDGLLVQQILEHRALALLLQPPKHVHLVYLVLLYQFIQQLLKLRDVVLLLDGLLLLG